MLYIFSAKNSNKFIMKEKKKSKIQI
jgi:hypothetical protein